MRQWTDVRRVGFWGGAALGGWVVAGYPAALALLPARPWRRDDAHAPTVTVVVPAFNERDALRAKLDGLHADPLPGRQVLVAVDEDELTAQAARDHPIGADVLWAPERGGKALALERALERATGDVVVLTDANNVLAPGAVQAAARHFADPSVWAVAGRRGERGSAYDRYEDLLRRLESRSGSCAAASGELLAVRRHRLPRFEDGVINDDLWLVCRIVAAGGRVVYEPAASSVEDAVGVRAEVARRSRIGAGRVALLGELRRVPPGFAVRLLSHKFGRLALPFAFAGTLGGALALAPRRPAYAAAAAAQLGVVGLGVAGATGRVPPGRAGRVTRALGQVVVGNWAIALGVVRGLRGRQSVTWEAVR